MTYTATVRRVLISCPSDVPKSDLAVINRAIGRWNVIYGRQFTAVVLPVSWGHNAAAEFGRPPQDILNEQLVDDCDMCIAIFANRLGTQTPNADSGTVEEINRLHDAGKYVAILRSAALVDPGMVDPEQLSRLNDYLKRNESNSLVLSYSNPAELQNHVDTILATAVSRDRSRAEMQLQSVGGGPDIEQQNAEVWPRVDSEERVKSDSKGRVRSSRSWYLTLTNTGPAPARSVSFRTETAEGAPGEAWFVHRGDELPSVIEVIPPKGGNIRFPIFASFGSAPEVRCVVTWTDGRGKQETISTLRLS